ncbi:hypothetical protein V3C99_011253 [Haemonchus contortus]
MDDEVDVEVPGSFVSKARAETARNVEQKKKEKASEPPPKKEPPPPEPSSEGSSSEEDDDEVSDEKSAESPEKEPVKQIPTVRSSREERPSAPRAASAVPTKQAVPSKPVVQPTRQSTLRQLPIEAQKKQMSPTAPAQPSKQSRMDEDEVDVEIPQQSSRRSAGHVVSTRPVASPVTESEAPKKQKSQAALTQSSKQSQVDDDEVQVDAEIPQQNYRSPRRSAGHLSSPATESDNAENQSDDCTAKNRDNSERDSDNTTEE